MRTTRLATIALQAEKLRLERLARFYISCAIFWLIGAAFAISALIFAHVAAYLALRTVLPAHWTALSILGSDIVLSVIAFALALRRFSDPVAKDAQQVRDDACRQIRATFAFDALARPLLRLCGTALATWAAQAMARRQRNTP